MSDGLDPESWPSYKRSILGRMDGQDEELKTIRDDVKTLKETVVEIRTSARTVLYILGIVPTLISLISLVLSIYLALRK